MATPLNRAVPTPRATVLLIAPGKDGVKVRALVPLAEQAADGSFISFTKGDTLVLDPARAKALGGLVERIEEAKPAKAEKAPAPATPAKS